MRGDIEISSLILILSLALTLPHRFGRPVLSRNKRIPAQNPGPLLEGEGNNPLFFSVASVAKSGFSFNFSPRVPRGITWF